MFTDVSFPKCGSLPLTGTGLLQIRKCSSNWKFLICFYIGCQREVFIINLLQRRWKVVITVYILL